ncbi:type 1 glutamine amidotransferase domain-containing protein [Lapidilactobacillus wuchangensis]|uniref:type 1 glutamine amidotransferase domain-containing protein n=1 Tax=Lapidilactobacillus wuchangensis TaxID=2486001 RepID=UPI000F7680CC|nr:type 1 glutamine amidotransferase domain-containing protein [Lapidilactobacillus wuchangensis]
MKKVLIVLTNVTRYQGTDEPTGLWLGEAAEFITALQKAGIAYDFASPKGGFVPLDPRSMKYTDAEMMSVYESADFKERALTHSLAAATVDPSDYQAIYFTGGHGVMWDFPDDANLQRLTLAIYQNNGWVLSVCHGIAGLLNVRDAAGQYLINGRTITGFTKTEEILAGKKRVVPFLNQQVATDHGAHFIKKRAYSEFATQDGHFITGQNPFSVKAVANLFLENIQKEQ